MPGSHERDQCAGARSRRISAAPSGEGGRSMRRYSRPSGVRVIRPIWHIVRRRIAGSPKRCSAVRRALTSRSSKRHPAGIRAQTAHRHRSWIDRCAGQLRSRPRDRSGGRRAGPPRDRPRRQAPAGPAAAGRPGRGSAGSCGGRRPGPACSASRRGSAGSPATPIGRAGIWPAPTRRGSRRGSGLSARFVSGCRPGIRCRGSPACDAARERGHAEGQRAGLAPLRGAVTPG